MKKYYQSVTTCSRSDDEWLNYEGYNKAQAIAVTKHHKFYNDAYHTTDTREFILPDDRDFEELSEDEQIAVLCCGYTVVDD